MTRPADLPDFRKPPLDEVLMGIQFAPPANYQQINAGEVWALFREDFPTVQELPPLAPIFETFGQPAGARFNFGVMMGVQHDRFWFVSKDGDQLIQFQNDRLIHNWRKVQNLQNEYPRFETIIKKFNQETEKLIEYFSLIGGAPLQINQCEIAYINHILPQDIGRINPADWLSFFQFGEKPPEDFALSFRRKIDDREGRPIGRLLFDCATATKPDGQEIINLTITARAMPETPTLQSTLEFFHRGRDMIVRSFAEVTTDSAHEVWERLN